MVNPALSRRQSLSICSAAVGLMLFVAWWFGLREPVLKAFPSDVLPLAVGDKLPWPAAEGWLNGAPVPPDDLAGKVVVVDIWTDICPYCEKAAPDLVALKKTYEGQNVEFIGLTGRGRDKATGFVRRNGLAWPNAYGVASLETTAPSIFVLGTDGRITWYDSHSRITHNIADFGRNIAAAIDQALDAASSTGG
jgi:thiol-disulfide isomerase/thioredoxin